MSDFTSKLFKDVLPAGESASAAPTPPPSLEGRVADLESDLGRVALMARALMDACIKKGVVSQLDIAQMLRAIDASDGVEDGRLDPKMLRGRPSGP
jgi:hypothetical protein